MSLTDVLTRISQIESLVAPAPVQQTAATTSATSNGGFARALMAATAAMPAETPSGGSGQAVLAAAESQLGQAESPAGSNDGAAISVYRSAVAGAQAGAPWCADFTSWAAAQAGTPLGDSGQGLGSVAEITNWASSNGKLLPADSTPAPGDLILFGTRHIGVVESANPDGTITTVEGNSHNAVSRVTRQPGEWTGFVSMS